MPTHLGSDIAMPSKWAYIEYEARPTWDDGKGMWKSHTHLVPMGDGQVCVLETEEALILLADAVRACGSDRHEGHAYRHGDDEPQLAFEAGAHQLLTVDYDKEMRTLGKSIRMKKKWGGHMPAAVLMHDQEKKLQIMIPDQHGDPTFREVAPQYQDLLPTPTSDVARRDKLGIGWRIKKGKNRRK